MKKKYPYLQDSYFQTTFNEELEKRNILADIQNFVNQRQYIKMTLLDWKERPIKSIEGEISGGSISKNATSPVRRTANLSCAVDAGAYSVQDMRSDFAINKKIFIEVGILNETDKYPDYPIFWFPEGVFFISSFSMNSSSTSAVNINLTLKDKMAMLNGDVGGTLPAMTVFDSMETQLADGSYATKKVLIYNIIKELVNHYGSEDLNNIVIEDVPLRIRRVVRWTGSDPLYRIGNPDIAQELNNSTIFTLKEPEEAYQVYYPGDDVGYIRDDFVVTGELVGNAGETVTAILDKIKNILGNYEYFYDVFGIFHFREIKNYLNTTQGEISLDDMAEKDYLIEINNSKSIFTFSDKTLLTSITATPLYENIKNDYIVQGVQEDSTTGAQREVRYHLAIDRKPRPLGIDTRENVSALVDWSEEIANAEEDLNTLKKYLNYYRNERQKLTNKVSVTKIQLSQRKAQLKRWGDALKEAIRESVEEYGTPSGQIIASNIFPSLTEKDSIYPPGDGTSEKDLKTFKVEGNEIKNIPSFYNLDFIGSITPQANDGSFQTALNNYYKTFPSAKEFSQTIYENLTPEGYWYLLGRSEFCESFYSNVFTSVWLEKVYQWCFVYWKLEVEHADGWNYQVVQAWNPETRKNTTTENTDVIETNEHLLISKPEGLASSIYIAAASAFNGLSKKTEANFRKVLSENILGNNAYSEDVKSSKMLYWDSAYNLNFSYQDNGETHSPWIDKNGTVLTLDKLCTDRINQAINIPKIYLRYESYEAKASIVDVFARNKQMLMEAAIALEVVEKLTLCKNLWDNGDYSSVGEDNWPPDGKISGTYDSQAWMETGFKYTADEYTKLERDIDYYQKRYDMYTKAAGATETQLDTLNQAISNLIIQNKYEVLNMYYENYQKEIFEVCRLESQLKDDEEALKKGGVLYYLIPIPTTITADNVAELRKYLNYILGGLESKDDKLTTADSADTVYNSLNKSSDQWGNIVEEFSDPSGASYNAVLVLEDLINRLNEIIKNWKEDLTVVTQSNPHKDENYYWRLYNENGESKPLILYEDEHTGLIRAGFGYTITGENPVLPPVGNFNLVYLCDNKYYKWNGTSYYQPTIKGVYTNKDSSDKQLDYYFAYDWRTALYLQGEYARLNGTDQGYYYPELAAFWNQTYDLVNQCFFGQASKPVEENDEDENIVDPYASHNLTTGPYYLDFMDSINTGFGQWSVENIGRRTDVVISDEVNCLFQPEIPNINLLNVSHSNSIEVYDIENEIPDSLRYLETLYPNATFANKLDYLKHESMSEHEPWTQVEDEIYNYFYTGGYLNGAYDQIKYELFLHTRYQTSISLTAIPVFYLEPNSRITIVDNTTNTYGDYIIQNISITFGPGANMSVSCTEAAERF